MNTHEEKKAWPPRVWVHTLDRKSVVPVHALIHFEPEHEHHEYLSLAEYEATVSELKERVGKLRAALELISGPSEFNCEVGEANQRAAAQAALAADGEG